MGFSFKKILLTGAVMLSAGTGHAGLISFDGLTTGLYSQFTTGHNHLNLDGMVISSANNIGILVRENGANKNISVTNSEDALIFTRDGGGLFTVDSFDVASRLSGFDVSFAVSTLGDNNDQTSTFFDIEDTVGNFQTITQYSGQPFSAFRIGLAGSGSFVLDNFNWNEYVAPNNGNDPVAAVPEPSSIALLGMGLAGLGFTRRAKRS